MDLISVTTLDQKGRGREMGRGKEKKKHGKGTGGKGEKTHLPNPRVGRWVSLESRR